MSPEMEVRDTFDEAAKAAGQNKGTYYSVEGEAEVTAMIDKMAALVGLKAGEAVGYILIVQTKDDDAVIAGNVNPQDMADCLVSTAIYADPAILDRLADIALTGLMAMIDSEEQ